MPLTVVVTLTDQNYYTKAQRTISEIRTVGQWYGDVVLIAVDFVPDREFVEKYHIEVFPVKHINTDNLIQQYRIEPIRPTCDNREFKKLTQWDKFYVFDPFFKKWDKTIFFDAGLHVYNDINHFNSIDLPAGTIMAPDDAPSYDQNKRFGGIIETVGHQQILGVLYDEFGKGILTQRYFLNCLWIVDNSLIDRVIRVSELVEYMNKYPIARCNEMTIMNLIFVFKYHLWVPLPEFSHIQPTKRWFGWSEHDRNYGAKSTVNDFYFIKYPIIATPQTKNIHI